MLGSDGLLGRRDLIAAGLAGIAALAGGATARSRRRPSPFFGTRDLGVQLHSVRTELDADFAGTLVRLRGIGLRTVELSGFHGRSAAQLKAAFVMAGLRCTSAHVPAFAGGTGPSLEGDLDELTRDMHAIGVTDVLVPVPLVPHRAASGAALIAMASALTADDWRRSADVLNATGRALHARDLRMGYHNLNFEFAPHLGETGMDILLSHTDPALVSFELDAGWAAAAGCDPVALLRAHPGRFTQMHIKDLKPGMPPNYVLKQSPVTVGAGRMDWHAILPAADAAGVRRYYVEQDPPFAGPRIRAIARSASYLLSLETVR